MPKGWRK